MKDFSFWWYIIAAVIYFLTRGKKRKGQPASRPESGNNPQPGRTKSFEDLLKEITEGRTEEQPTVQQETVIIEERESEEENRRVFADDESRKVYEESIKMAEGTDLEFTPDESFQESRLFKGTRRDLEGEEWSIADEIKDGLNSSEARKAIIYSEILTRKY